MKRDLVGLSENEYDVLVIGAGIHGAWIALDASLRGLSVAIVDKGDFGSATSSNTMKIIHGGLRYLQQADFYRMRQSIRERSILMSVAPHLVHPLPFLIPTYGHSVYGKEVMSLALAVNDIIGFDRNRMIKDPKKQIPRGRVISRQECLRLFPGVDERGLTGGAIWYDCQMYNSERLLISVLRSAEEKGAQIANYVEVVGFISYGNRIQGVRAIDRLGGERLDIRARVVVNTSGPWVGCVLDFLGSRAKKPKVFLSKAINLVLNCQIIPDYGVGLRSRFRNSNSLINRKARLLFITPWRSCSLIGTFYSPYEGSPDGLNISEEDIESFVNEINEVYPYASVSLKDISFIHRGLVPVDDRGGNGDIKLAERYRIWDHARGEGIEGLVSVVGVKYTTARAVAKEVIDLVFRKLGKTPPGCLTALTPIYGGCIEDFGEFLSREMGKKLGFLSQESMRHLIYNYGSKYDQVLKYINDNPDMANTVEGTSDTIKAEVVYGIREEMAQKLSDVVFRRTGIGSSGNPGDKALESCALIMARELNWGKERIRREIEEVKKCFSIGC
jgi:glycerol-3-phosphate dehydrogenase